MSEQKKVSHDVLVDLVKSIIEDSIDEPQFSTREHALMGVEKIRDEYLAAHDREVKAAALRDFADSTRFPSHWILFRRHDGSGVTVSDLLRDTADRIESEARP